MKTHLSLNWTISSNSATNVTSHVHISTDKSNQTDDLVKRQINVRLRLIAERNIDMYVS